MINPILIEPIFIGVFPLLFIIVLFAGSVALRRRRIDMDGAPPIDKNLFRLSKFAIVVPWAAMILHSLGLRLSLAGGPRVLKWISLGLWALSFALLSAGRLGMGSSFRVGCAKEVTTLRENGLFRYSRNPMYLGIYGTLLASAFYTMNPIVLLTGVFVVVVHHRIVLGEESCLRKTFGEEYMDYCRRVRRYLTTPFATRENEFPGEFASLSHKKRWNLRRRSLGNLLKMGHCAPAVMMTILQIRQAEEDWPVKLAAGLPGGIGDTGFECGGITSPLIGLGMHYGLGNPHEGLPLIFDKGHEHFRRFQERNGTPLCREILGDNYRLTRCIRAVCCAPEIALEVATRDCREAISGEQREAYGRLYSHMKDTGFHCSHEVLRRLSPIIPLSGQVLDAASGFMGGTLFKGMTCSALVAGVMALGFRMREFENSIPRVMRMIVLMKTGGHAFDDHINKFNVIMNRGKSLSRWFAGEFGDTQCRAVTGCDFSSSAGVGKYIETDCLHRCRSISEKVADKILAMALDQARPAGGQIPAY